jgi:hypothetical protein
MRLISVNVVRGLECTRFWGKIKFAVPEDIVPVSDGLKVSSDLPVHQQ